jgi:hypothetical protein
MGVSGEASTATPAPTTAPAAPTRPIGTSVAASRWPRDAPRALTVSWPVAASDSSLARVWPTTTSAAAAARAANSTRAAAWARIPSSTVRVTLGRGATPTSGLLPASRRVAAAKPAMSAWPRFRRTRTAGKLATLSL